mgnify:CR=1 FL=1
MVEAGQGTPEGMDFRGQGERREAQVARRGLHRYPGEPALFGTPESERARALAHVNPGGTGRGFWPLSQRTNSWGEGFAALPAKRTRAA